MNLIGAQYVCLPLPCCLPTPRIVPGGAQSLDVDLRIRRSCWFWGQKSGSEGLLGLFAEPGGSSGKPKGGRPLSQASLCRLPCRLDVVDGPALPHSWCHGSLLPAQLLAASHRASQVRARPVMCQRVGHSSRSPLGPQLWSLEEESGGWVEGL